MEEPFNREIYVAKMFSAYYVDRYEGKKIAEEVINAAQLHNDLKLEFDAKILYMQCCVFLDQSEEVLATYPWILAQMDAYPNRFNERSALWAYKWVLHALPKFPHISLAQINAALADMERRFIKYNTNNKSVIVYYKATIANATGNMEELKKQLDAFKKIKNKRDTLGDCKACVADSVVKAYVNTAQFEEALVEAAPILAKTITCGEVPERTYPSVIMCQWHLGNLKEAQSNYLKYKRFINDHKAQLDDIADILTYLSLTNKLPKAIELFEQKFHFSMNRYALMDNFDYYLGALLLFRQLKLKRGKTVKLNMPKNFELYAPDNTYVVETMYNYLMEQAIETAHKFDARNGNTYFSERIDKQLQLVGKN